METVITRDTDIIREYLAALDSRARSLSPFARFAATVKLAKLQQALASTQIESTDDDILELRREISERLNRTAWRRFIARPWGARLTIILTIIAGQQLVLAALLLAALLFMRFAPVPRRWNPLLPHEQPPLLFVFIFLFFAATPLLAMLIVFGGRYFRAWRITAPATALIIALSALGTYLVTRNREHTNPVRHLTSIEQLAKERDVTISGYRQWTESVWLTRDPQFQRDYESYLRTGPGRWITARLASSEDTAWQPRNDDSDALKLMSSYLDSGQDENGFREWLRYYFDRNRIYSQDRIDQEVDSITGSANQRYLGIWQMEPYLKERDQRLYRSYLGSVGSAMRKWGAGWMALLSLVFLAFYLVPGVSSAWSKATGEGRGGVRSRLFKTDRAASPSPGLNNPGFNFPERSEITTPAFFDAPLKLLGSVHRSFLRIAVSTSIIVFLFWAVVYLIGLTSRSGNPRSQVELMKSHILFAGYEPETGKPSALTPSHESTTYVTAAGSGEPDSPAPAHGNQGKQANADRQVEDLERQVEESDYQNTKRFKEQYQALASHKADVDALRSTTSQIQQSTTGLPEQLTDLGSRANAAEARAGQVGSEAAAARQAADQLNSKIKDVETRAQRAADQVGRVESQVSTLATRTDVLDRELERRARQIEARTEELGERTEVLKEASERTQRIAFTAILSELKTAADELDRRVSASFYRFINKTETRADADTLAQRIKSLAAEVQELKSDQARQWLAELEDLSKRVDEIAARIK